MSRRTIMLRRCVYVQWLLIISVFCEKQTCSIDGHGCGENDSYPHNQRGDTNLRRHLPGLKSIANGDYQFPANFFTVFCEVMNNKRGDAGFYDSWISSDIFIKRICSGETAAVLNKLVPCANDQRVRNSFIKSISNMPDLPDPTTDMSEEQAQNAICRFLTTTSIKFLKITQSNCDPKGFQTMLKLMTDNLKNSEDYNLPFESTCLVDAEAELGKQFQD